MMHRNLSLQMGGKGSSLVRLKAAGFQVPDFICLDVSHFEEARSSGFRLSPRTRDTVEAFLAAHSGLSFAVRSSANMEDGSEHSFAGLFETFLDLKSKEDVFSAVEKCWSSVDSDRVREYCKRRKIPFDQLKMAVVVQRFIAPDFAGVAFSLNPMTGKDEEILVEMVRGVGETLVSGKVTPDRWVLSRSLFAPALLQREGESTGMPDSWAPRLRDLVTKIQAAYKKPQDIEWAAQGDQLYVLQSRDITSYQFSQDLGEWTTADFRDGGVSSGVVSPVMWSLYESIFATSLPDYLCELGLLSREKARRTCWYKVFFARPYWNLEAVKDTQATLPGFNERGFDQDMAIPITYEGNGKETPVTVLGILRALPILFKLRAGYKRQIRAAEKLIEDFDAIEASLKNLRWSELKEHDFVFESEKLIRDTYLRVESTYFRTIYNASNAKLEFSEDLAKIKKVDPEAEYVKLIADLGNLGVTNSVFDLWTLVEKHRGELAKLPAPLTPEKLGAVLKLPEFVEMKLDLDQFLERYYFHGPRELDLLVPRWKEDPTFIFEIFVKLFNEPTETKSPEILARKRKETFEQELARLERVWKKDRLLRWGRSGTMKKLERVRYFLWLREELRDRSTRVYFFIRQMLMEAGRRSGLERLVFFLTIEEALSLIRKEMGVAEARARAEDRERYAEGFAQFKNPNEIGARYNAGASSTSTGPVDASSLRGIGCSAGSYRGRARVIRTLSESHRVNQGDILVTAFTDPGWTPLFSLVGAVVTETGGLLSHAALISREYGIPSVLNVRQATDVIRDGDMLEVNGTQGTVTRI
jgi:pyruvate,water dikinase